MLRGLKRVTVLFYVPTRTSLDPEPTGVKNFGGNELVEVIWSWNVCACAVPLSELKCVKPLQFICATVFKCDMFIWAHICEYIWVLRLAEKIMCSNILQCQRGNFLLQVHKYVCVCAGGCFKCTNRCRLTIVSKPRWHRTPSPSYLLNLNDCVICTIALDSHTYVVRLSPVIVFNFNSH